MPNMTEKELIFLKIIEITRFLIITTVANIYVVLCARYHSKYFMHTYLILVNTFMIKILLLSPFKR